MSIVTPIPQQTSISLYADIAWDDSYKDIRWFTSETERSSYLNVQDRLVSTFTNCSVVKPGESIQLEGRLNDFIHVTYMVFENYGLSGFGRNKKFYCFVTAIDYVNVNTVRITYKLDLVQTYLFDFRFGACMVEREHVSDDTIGKWLLDEGFDIGEYLVRGGDKYVFEPAVFLYYLPEDYETPVSINKVVTCVKCQAFRLPLELDALGVLLKNLSAQPERILRVCMGLDKMRIPDQPDPTPISYATTMRYDTVEGFGETGFVGYTPHNNKLNCYPYRLLTIDNFNGNVEQLRLEEFDQPQAPEFSIIGVPNPKVCLRISPMNYKGMSYGTTPLNQTARQFRLEYDNFPDVPYVTDTFKRWVTESGMANVVSVASSVVLTALGIGGALKIGGEIGKSLAIQGAGQLASTAIETAQTVHEHALHNRQISGSVGSAGMNYWEDEIGFRVIQYGIRSEVAQRIDGYFDRYGYRVDVVKVPNITGRQYVNYVKTINAHVSGNVPMEARRALESAMDNGCSFWHVDSVDMTLVNNPIVGG